MFLLLLESVAMMQDHVSMAIADQTYVPARKRLGHIAGLFRTTSKTQFQTKAVSNLELGFGGIAGDRHEGHTRRSGGREPWYPRGTEMRNERQLSLLSPDDLKEIASGLDVTEVRADWMGGNILLSDFPQFTLLPPRTYLFFEGGVTIRIDGLNVPCRSSGRSIASHYPERENLDLAFVRVAKRLRGLVGFVEKPGVIKVGEVVEARIPEQWIYSA
jgi:hypothetical protein